MSLRIVEICEEDVCDEEFGSHPLMLLGGGAHGVPSLQPHEPLPTPDDDNSRSTPIKTEHRPM